MNEQLLEEPALSTQGAARAAADDLPGEGLSVRLIRNRADLDEHLPAWERLVETALEPNPFFAPHLFLPAVEHLAGDAAPEVALVFAPRRMNAAASPVLCGFFPLERPRAGRRLAPRLSIWRHIHCFLGTPLLRREVASETLAAFLDWLASDPRGTAAIRFPALAADGPVHRLLVEQLYRRGNATWVARRHLRAIFRRGTDAETFTHRAMPRKRRHELRRLEKRLSEQGRLERDALQPGGDVDGWLDEFLKLEARGWKGRSATALASSAADDRFFRAAARGAHSRGRLMMLALRLDGRAIAMKCNFLAADGGFAFKIAFDEEFARYSPGTLLEMDNIAVLHERNDVAWMDSCADPDHPMINHLWPDRRTIEWLWASTGRSPGNLLVSSMPALKWVKGAVLRRRAGA